MTSTKKDPVIVVLQLTGGNDYFNTVVPYNEGLAYNLVRMAKLLELAKEAPEAQAA